MASGSDWTLVDAFDGKKKKKSKSRKQNEKSMEFEVIATSNATTTTKEDQHTFEVIPKQKVRSFEDNPLNVREDYFSDPIPNSTITIPSNDNNNVNFQYLDSDSDIEVVSKHASKLYSDILQKQFEHSPKKKERFSSSSSDSVERGEEVLEEEYEGKEEESKEYDDDSEIEVIGQGFNTDLLLLNQNKEQTEQGAVSFDEGDPNVVSDYFKDDDDGDDDFQIEFREDYEDEKEKKIKDKKNTIESEVGEKQNECEEQEEEEQESMVESEEEEIDNEEEEEMNNTSDMTQSFGLSSLFALIHKAQKAQKKEEENDQNDSVDMSQSSFELSSLFGSFYKVPKAPEIEKDDQNDSVDMSSSSIGLLSLFAALYKSPKAQNREEDDDQNGSVDMSQSSFGLSSLFASFHTAQKAQKREDDDQNDSVDMSQSGFGISSLFASVHQAPKAPKTEEYDDELNNTIDMAQSTFGLSSLFDSFYQAPENPEPTNNLVTMTTWTLVFVFCLSIVAGVSVGTGLGSLFTFKQAEEDSVIIFEKEESVASSAIPSDFLNYDDDGEFKATRKTIKEIMTSFRQLERDYNSLRSGYEDYKQRYQLQRSMVWYWRKRAKHSQDVELNYPIIKIDEGMMVNHFVNKTGMKGDEVSNISMESASEEVLIVNLTKQLKKERKNTIYWKTKYTSLKLSKIRTCAKIGKSMAPSTFSFSGCLMIFSNAIPDLNISSNLLNITRPVESISDHVHKAWSNLKNRWRTDIIQYEAKKRSMDAKRFRKMLTIGNIVNSQNKQGNVKNALDEDDDKFCEQVTRENRGKRKYHILSPKIQFMQPKTDFKVTSQKPSPKNTKCPVVGGQQPCEGKNKNINKEEIKNDFLRPSDGKPKINLLNSRGKGRNDNRKDTQFLYTMFNENTVIKEKEWLKKKLDEVMFMFENYKLEMDSKLRNTREDIQKQTELYAAYRKHRVKKLKKQKRVLTDKVNNLKEKTKNRNNAERKQWDVKNSISQLRIKELKRQINDMEKEKEYWENIEKKHLVRKVKQMETIVKKQKQTFNTTVQNLKKKFKNYISTEKKKKTEKDDKSHQILKLKSDKAARKISYYKSKYNQAKQDIEQVRFMYKDIKSLQQQSEKVIEHLEDKLKNYRKMVRANERLKNQNEKKSKLQQFRYLEKVTQNWMSYDNDLSKQGNDAPYPTVFCPDQTNCQSNNKENLNQRNNYQKEELFDLTKSHSFHPAVLNPSFELTKYSNFDDILFSNLPQNIHPPMKLKAPFFPPKPEPPRKLRNDKRYQAKSVPLDFFLSKLPHRPSPPRSLKQLEEKLQKSQDNSSEDALSGDDSSKVENKNSWYLAWGAHRSDNREEDGRLGEPESDNWYVEMMNLRDSYRAKLYTDEYSDDKRVNKLNWYIKAMMDRDEERDDWYVKWMKNRRKN